MSEHAQPNRTGPILAVVGAAAVILGSLLPWATLMHVFGSASMSGIEGDGTITLALGAVLLIGAILQLASDRWHVWTEVVAVVTLVIAIFELANVATGLGDADSEFARASVGVGLYVLLVGAGLAVVGTDMTRRSRKGLERGVA